MSGHVIKCLFSIFFRVERKERARLKTVKFNAKPGVIDSKGVGTKQLKHEVLLVAMDLTIINI